MVAINVIKECVKEAKQLVIMGLLHLVLSPRKDINIKICIERKIKKSIYVLPTIRLEMQRNVWQLFAKEKAKNMLE